MDSWPMDLDYSLGSLRSESENSDPGAYDQIPDDSDIVDYYLDLLLKRHDRQESSSQAIKISVQLENVTDLESPRRGEVIAKIRPRRRYWVGPIDEYHCGFCFTPLAVTSLVTSVLVALYGILNIEEVVADGVISWSESADTVVAVFKLVCATLAIFGVVCRWTLGIHAQIIGLHVLMVSSLINALLKCIEWSNAYRKDNWIPTAEEKWFMVKYVLMLIFLLTAIPLVVLGPLLSLYKVLDNGGSGWEYKNYLQMIWDLQLAEVIAKKYVRTKASAAATMNPPPFALLSSRELSASRLLASVRNTLYQRDRGKRMTVW